MAKATYKQRGEALDYINNTAAAIEAGDVVVAGKIVGVAGTNIPAGALGSLHVMGVYAFPKGAGAISAGAPLFWDNTAGTATDSGDVALGYAAQAADEDDTTVDVLLDRSAG